MRVFNVNTIEEFEKLNISARSEGIIGEKMDYVRGIVKNVRENGDDAVIKYTKEFDGIEIDKSSLKVSDDEIKEAFEVVEDSFKEAIKYAAGNLEKFHSKELPKEFKVSVEDGIELGLKWAPIETVGLYVPGGRAPYVTACYMLGVPARVAGCKNRIICVPPDKTTGKVNPYILVSAVISGATAIYKVGGAQAIAAMAYGTETIPKVGKIFGPGNVFVTCAKLLVYGAVDIDAPAGPSEALIIADESTDPTIAAADMISQAEHDVNSAAVMLTNSKEFAEKLIHEVRRQTDNMARKDTINEAFERYGAIVICKDTELSIEIANSYAPEHIQILTKNCLEDAEKIRNSGSVCIGKYTPIAAGDYLSGVNNCIPTGGAAKNFSPVSTQSYMKCFQTQYVTEKGLRKVSDNLKIISGVEGFGAHYNSVEVRLK